MNKQPPPSLQEKKHPIQDPYPPFKRYYPNMRQRDFVVNRCFKNKPKPSIRNRKAELGNYVYMVPDKLYTSRIVNASDMESYPRARVVGESIFGYKSNYTRLLQLLEDSTGRMFYVSEAEVKVPLFT
jgi:hypothetical protein